MSDDLSGFTARILQTPAARRDPHGALSTPVYQNAAYEFATADAMELAFTGRTSDHAYSRITNPTVEHFEQRIRRALGAHSVTALNSGMAAISNLLMTVGRAGANVIASPHLFGNTYSLLVSTLGDVGLSVRWADTADPAAVEAAIDAFSLPPA